jgi:16S rRNA (adenine1518-N6/adenine1519-N6)-dimethyltransferase
MLVSQVAVNRLIESCELSPNNRVLEIGAGEGILTKLLAERAAFVLSFEIDPRLCMNTRTRLSGLANLELICADAFDYPLTDQRFDACVTSLPFSQSLRFVKWLAERAEIFTRTIAVVQSEFADKMNSDPGYPSYRAVSVISQIAFNMNMLFQVKRDYFRPPPRVGSTAIRLQPAPEVAQPFFNPRRIRILDFIFSFRGRRLSSALKKLGTGAWNNLLPGSILESRVESISPIDYMRILPVVEEVTTF